MSDFYILQSTYDLAVSRKDLVTQAAVIKALHKLAKTNSTLPTWVTALGIKPATPAVTMGGGIPPGRALERAIAAAKAQRLLTPLAFGTVDDAALDSLLNLDPVLHAVASQALGSLTTAARALRPAGVESPAHAAWRTKTEAARAALTRAQAASPTSVVLLGALHSAIGREPPYDDGGAATVAAHAVALAAVVALLG